jgi:hypothetical protein
VKEKYCEKCKKVVVWEPPQVEIGEGYMVFPITCLSGNSRHFCKHNSSGNCFHDVFKCDCLDGR